MKQRLIKVENDYRLLDKNNSIIGTTDLEYQQAFSDVCQKLSIKNCEAIANGYDLDELVKTTFPSLENCGVYLWMSETDRNRQRSAFIKGFHKALEILGDKKFSEKELTMLFAYGHQIGMNNVLAIQSQHSPQPMPKPDSDKLRDELIQSLQQTEWEVVIEMEVVSDFDSRAEIDGQVFSTNKKQVPKLDANGFITLKRKV